MYSGNNTTPITPYTSRTHPNSHTKPCTDTLRPHTPLPLTGKHRNVLPCLGNIICWRLAPPTMLPGHGRHLCGFYLGAGPCITPPHRHTNLIASEVQEVQKHAGANNHHLVPGPLQPPATAPCLERTKTTPMPPAPQESDKKTQKPRRRRQNALRRFLATSATIVCARFQWYQPPGSPIGLPGKFQGCRSKVSGRYTRAVRIFCTRIGNYIICTQISTPLPHTLSRPLFFCST